MAHGVSLRIVFMSRVVSRLPGGISKGVTFGNKVIVSLEEVMFKRGHVCSTHLFRGARQHTGHGELKAIPAAHDSRSEHVSS